MDKITSFAHKDLLQRCLVDIKSRCSRVSPHQERIKRALERWYQVSMYAELTQLGGYFLNHCQNSTCASVFYDFISRASGCDTPKVRWFCNNAKKRNNLVAGQNWMVSGFEGEFIRVCLGRDPYIWSRGEAEKVLTKHYMPSNIPCLLSQAIKKRKRTKQKENPAPAPPKKKRKTNKNTKKRKTLVTPLHDLTNIEPVSWDSTLPVISEQIQKDILEILASNGPFSPVKWLTSNVN